jgi:hypothetical protein
VVVIHPEVRCVQHPAVLHLTPSTRIQPRIMDLFSEGSLLKYRPSSHLSSLTVSLIFLSVRGAIEQRLLAESSSSYSEDPTFEFRLWNGCS